MPDPPLMSSAQLRCPSVFLIGLWLHFGHPPQCSSVAVRLTRHLAFLQALLCVPDHSITVARYPLGPCLRRAPLPRPPCHPPVILLPAYSLAHCFFSSAPPAPWFPIHQSSPGQKPSSLARFLLPPPLSSFASPAHHPSFSPFPSSSLRGAVCAPVLSLPIIIFWLRIRIHHRRILSTCYTKKRDRKKDKKKEESGKLSAKHILILVFYLRHFHSPLWSANLLIDFYLCIQYPYDT